MTRPRPRWSPVPPEEQTQEFLARLSQVADGDRPGLLQELIAVNVPFARRLARRYEGRGVPTEDLHQVACLGLVKAAHRFDPGRGDFYGFAAQTVRGEIKRYFRDTSWTVRPSRPVQELSPELSRATEAMTHELGRSPTPREVAERLGVDVEDVVETLVGRQGHTAQSLDAPRPSGAALSWADVLPADDVPHARLVDRVVLRQVLSGLPSRQKRILALRFFSDMTQEQIGREMGVTQVQVSRLISRTLAQLRQQMTDDAEPELGA